jgi:hypothetical protein
MPPPEEAFGTSPAERSMSGVTACVLICPQKKNRCRCRHLLDIRMYLAIYNYFVSLFVRRYIAAHSPDW